MTQISESDTIGSKSGQTLNGILPVLPGIFIQRFIGELPAIGEEITAVILFSNRWTIPSAQAGAWP